MIILLALFIILSLLSLVIMVNDLLNTLYNSVIGEMIHTFYVNHFCETVTEEEYERMVRECNR